MEVRCVTELKPVSNQKSFSGKALLHWEEHGIYLQSYETIVAYVDDSKVLHRLWGGYSATTQKHIDAFSRTFCGEGCNKQQWLKMEVE